MAAKSALFVTEGQIAQRMGLDLDQFRIALPALSQAGFPPADPLFANRRYWPACQAFLDRRYGLSSSSPSANPALDEVEPWKRKRSA